MKNRVEARRLAEFIILVAVLAAGYRPSLGANLMTAQAGKVRFPDTPAGRAAAAYFKAFNSGEAAMQGFFERFAAKGALQKTPIPVRLEMYRQIRVQVGALEIQGILGSGPNSISVSARTQNGTLLELDFTLEPAEPHGLLEILCIEPRGTRER